MTSTTSKISKTRITFITTVAAAALSGLVLTGGGAEAQQQVPSIKAYTTLDHPALPCHLSVEAVANWGETSAHLPLACTYGPK